jgi:hypothetical protein
MHANPGNHFFVQTGADEETIVRGGQMRGRANDDRLRGQEYDAIVYSECHAVASQIATHISPLLLLSPLYVFLFAGFFKQLEAAQVAAGLPPENRVALFFKNAEQTQRR